MAIKTRRSTIKQDDRQEKINRSKNYTNCLASAAMAINNLHDHGRLLDVSTLMDELTKSADRVATGDISEIEQMLMAQAKMLDYIFYDSLNYLADLNLINQVDLISTMAFRAQSQCRKTLSTLAELKHPRRVMFVKQQNNAVNQQINNSLENSNSEKIKNIANELLSEVNHEALDFRGTPATSSVDKEMEALAISRG